MLKRKKYSDCSKQEKTFWSIQCVTVHDCVILHTRYGKTNCLAYCFLWYILYIALDAHADITFPSGSERSPGASFVGAPSSLFNQAQGSLTSWLHHPLLHCLYQSGHSVKGGGGWKALRQQLQKFLRPCQGRSEYLPQVPSLCYFGYCKPNIYVALAI